MSELFCQKCSHRLEEHAGDTYHCPHCNLLWRWDESTLSLLCLGYPPRREGGQRPSDAAGDPPR
ncbi:MAG: hypothetical protein Kow0047_04990 [Anaerolineae bacterium]